uniref:Uncharacterized protein n=1 Tax=Glossina palpalis gambiensis TaxID=67801 RepID=A0A1B0C5X6_9MUSC
MEDTLHGCNYTDERTKKNTCAYKTVLAFAVRSLMTAFIMLMSVRNTWEFRCRSTTRQSQTGEGDWIRLSSYPGVPETTGRRGVRRRLLSVSRSNGPTHGETGHRRPGGTACLFRTKGSCSSGIMHRINLLGFVLFTLLTAPPLTASYR